MTVLLVLPLLLPCAAPLLARYLVGRLPPRAALRALTAAGLALGASTAAALGGLALAGALRLPQVARLGKLVHPMAGPGPAGVALPAGAAACAALALGACLLARSLLRGVRTLRAARAEARGARAQDGLCVVADDRVDAYALPGGGPGRVVVTDGMLRCLRADERAALVAHERAHLAGRHHLFLAAAALAAHCHPGLRAVRDGVALAVERAADEAAAEATGDRRLTARAIGRAALAAHAAPGGRVGVLPSATAGAVPRRVAALLEGPRPRGGRRPATAALCALLLLCSGASTAAALGGAAGLHSGVESAQGGTGGHHRPAG
ncbi:M48 family metalloprotease [Streptomyces sp. NPDC047002]|uniref:M48 family metalloprotease n=1 Tax=Streptomyces sp. NPDC047002 TaxID=3155475 RepID=UPI00345150AB